MRKKFVRRCGGALLGIACGLGTASAQEIKTAALVVELTKLMDSAKVENVAAALGGDRFAAALYFPGTQLLVVSAQYSVPQLLTQKLAAKAYQDVYIDLNSASVAGSKTFISDLGADGLRARKRGSDPVDSADVGTRSVRFDGDWGKQKLSEADYTSAFSKAEGDYTAALEALIGQLKKPS